MTEDEAKTKWCPFVRVTASETEWHTNRPSYADIHQTPFDDCIGSACMAWRWRPGKPEVKDGAFTGRMEPHSDGAGFCGLAGTP